MNKKIITILIVLMGISILGIISVQMVWINNAIRVKNELFSRSVNDALNNTVAKLEDIHNFRIVNDLAFSDSLHWIKNHDFDFDFPPLPPIIHFDSLKKPPRPLLITKKFNPNKGNTKIELKVDTKNNNRVHTYSYSIDAGVESNTEHIIIDDAPNDQDQVYIIQHDTIISDIDSLYTVSVIKIDSLLTHLDEAQIVKPDISKRLKTKAGNLKRVAKRALTEIVAWDERKIDKNLVNNVLSEELQNKNIPISFQFGIIRDSIVDLAATESDSLKLAETKYQVELYPNDIFQKNIKLAVFFPDRDNFVYRSLNWLLVASFFFSIIILVTFSLSIFYILRQKKISEMKSDFINNMTHEFKTPIATISVATDSFANEKVISDPEKIRYFAGMIKKENERMNLQVEDILTIARLDKKDFEFKWETTNLHDIIDGVAQGVVLQIEKRNGKIETKLNAENPIITTDKKHCKNIIYNLIDNAMKYSINPPKIKITTLNKSKGVMIIVEDNGIGMSKNVQGKIFEKFYRQPSGNVHNVKGFGLGLSYVKAIVEANQGTVLVQSEPGKGSIFEVFIPFARV